MSQELVGRLDEVLALYAAATKEDGPFEFYPHHFEEWQNGYAPFLAAACNLLRTHGQKIRQSLPSNPQPVAQEVVEALERVELMAVKALIDMPTNSIPPDIRTVCTALRNFIKGAGQ